jgi:hypothetical protein
MPWNDHIARDGCLVRARASVLVNCQSALRRPALLLYGQEPNLPISVYLTGERRFMMGLDSGIPS